MQINVLSKTKNVINLETMLINLGKRNFTEMTGLGLIWGSAGLGKTRAMQRLAINNGFMYIKLDSCTTMRAFILKLHKTISYALKLNLESAKGRSSKIFDECIYYLNQAGLNQGGITIVIDEIDYAFKDKKLLGIIRDIADDSITTNVIMVGMGEAREKLEKANSHYFDRCNYFVHFKPLSLEDTIKVCNDLCDFSVPDDICKQIYKMTRGTVRKIVKEIEALENSQGGKK